MNATQAITQFKSRLLTTDGQLLMRPQLMSLALQQSLLWINAPAGFGKSTFLQQLSQELQQQGMQVVRYVIDQRDSQAEYFLTQLLHCVEYQLQLSYPAELKETTTDVQQLMLFWLDFLKDHPHLVLVFDDVHLLDNSDTWELLLRLLELKTSAHRVYLAGRYLPHPLGKIHLKTELSWLDGDDLAFSDDQLQELLQLQGIFQAADLVPVLSDLLQGWPAGIGIWLSCFKAQGQPQNLTPGHIRQLAQRSLGDYLQGELLLTLTPAMQRLLQVCAVLKRFDEDLLQQCYGNDDYHPLLQQALQWNVFLRHDRTRLGWFQVHPVLAVHLATQLPTQQRRQLHQLAFTWLSQHSGYSVLALHHALEAGMTESVQNWLMQESEHILANLDIASLLHWFELLDQDWLERHPRLLAIYCWALLLTQQHEGARVKLLQLKKLNYLQGYEQKALEGYRARLDCQLSVAEELCLQAYKRLPSAHYTLRILMLTTLAQIAIAQQDLSSARQLNQQAAKIAVQFHAPGLEALTLYYSARIGFYSGQVLAAQEEVERGLQLLANFSDSAERLPRGRLVLYQVMLKWLTGTPSEQLSESLQQGLTLCQQQRDVAVCYGYAVQALMYSYQGQVHAAFKALDTAQWLMQRWRVEPKTYQWLQIVRVNLYLNHDQLIKAKQALEQLGQETKEQGVAQSELFPLLPGLLRLTQGRLLLRSGQVELCLAFIEKALKQKGSVIYRALLELLRALCLRQQNPDQGQQLLAVAVRSLQKEAISTDLLHWFAHLHEQSAAKVPSLPSHVASLSERELEVLQKISQGHSNQEIADQMFISLNTVKTHARKINIKLAAKNRTQALVRATELGLLL